MISNRPLVAPSAPSQADQIAEMRRHTESLKPLYPGLFGLLRDKYDDGSKGEKNVSTVYDDSLPVEQVLAARRSLFQFFDTPKWLWNPGLTGVNDTVVVRVPGEGRSILLRVQPLTDHDVTIAKMIELGGNEFRMEALRIFKKYVPTTKKPVDKAEEMGNRLWPKAPIRPVPDGTMSVEMLFNDVPMTVKGSRTSDLSTAQPQRNQNIRLGPPVVNAPVAWATGRARPPAAGPLRTMLGIQRSVTASVRALLAPPPASRPAGDPWRNFAGGSGRPPSDSRNPVVDRLAPIILALVAGGLLASAMIGAGLFSAPASALTISCSALLGVWFAVLAFREAARQP